MSAEPSMQGLQTKQLLTTDSNQLSDGIRDFVGLGGAPAKATKTAVLLFPSEKG
jgi:hypothetical protein